MPLFQSFAFNKRYKYRDILATASLVYVRQIAKYKVSTVKKIIVLQKECEPILIAASCL
jgi:hypothetical protein